MTLQFSDALERAKLAVDESGMLAPYTYNQLVSALPEEEQYPFTMALVELGIQTKWASYSKSEREGLQKLIDDEVTSEEPEEDGVERFAERLLRVAQQFVQSPGGLWMPSTWQEDEEVELSDEDLEEVDQNYEEIGEEDIISEEPLEEFTEYSSPEYVDHIRDVLEREGISVDKDGNVSFYQSNLPGIYTEQIPMKPMPLDLAYQRYYQSFNTAQKEQDRVKGILNAVSRMTPEMSDLQETTDFLANVKFSPKSRNKLVQSIGTDLGELNQILTDPDWYRIQPILDGLKGNLETYVQQFSAQEESAYEVLDSLDRLKDLQENDPEKFSEAVGGYGALAAFRRKSQISDEDFPGINENWEDVWERNPWRGYERGEGDRPFIRVMIGSGYIANRVQEENPALRGPMLKEEVSEWEEFFKSSFVSDVLDDLYFMEFCDDFELKIVPGDGYEVAADYFYLVPDEEFDDSEIEGEISEAIDKSFEGVYE